MGVTGWRVEQCRNQNGCAWAPIAEVDALTLDSMATNLQQSQSYCWRVQPRPLTLAMSNIVCR